MDSARGEVDWDNSGQNVNKIPASESSCLLKGEAASAPGSSLLAGEISAALGIEASCKLQV
jgi:hypothetical protein